MFDMRKRCLGALVQLYNIEGLLVLTKVPLVHQSAWLLCYCSDHLAYYLLEIVHLSREHLASIGPSDITALQSVLRDRCLRGRRQAQSRNCEYWGQQFPHFSFLPLWPELRVKDDKSNLRDDQRIVTIAPPYGLWPMASPSRSAFASLRPWWTKF